MPEDEISDEDVGLVSEEEEGMLELSEDTSYPEQIEN